MGYYDRDHPDEPIRVESRRLDLSGAFNTVSQLFVRTAGIIALLVGLWSGVKVIGEAWVLYDDPNRIERFAQAIERGSNIDRVLNPANAQSDGQSSAETGSGSAVANDFRLSYFAAWVIVVCLLLVVGRIAVWAIKTGGELALYDTDLKRFTRNLVEQAVRGERR